MGDEERDTEQGKDDAERKDDDAGGSSPEREKAVRQGKDDASRRAEGHEEDRSDEDDDSTPQRKDDTSQKGERDDERRRKGTGADEDEDENGDGGRGRKLKLLAAAIAGAVVVVVVAVLISSSGGEDESSPTSTTQREEQGGPIVGANAVKDRYAGVEQDGFDLGDPDADVTMVEFADLQCPFCKQASEASLPPLIQRYVKAGKLRIEFRNFAILGPDSEKAARALEAAAAQDKAWQFIELWYLNQGQENSGYVTDDFIRRIGGAIEGMDVEQLVVASNAEGGGGQSLREAAQDAEQFGIDSTPSYLIGRTGQQLSQLQLTNPSDVSQYTEAVDRLLIEEDVEGAGD